MRVFHFVIKKRKRALRPDFYFFYFPSWSLFSKCFCGFSILVCIGVQVFFRGLFFFFFQYFNSNHNLPNYSLFSKCFSWFFYLGVYRGTGVFSWLFFFHSSSRTWLALALASHLPPFHRKTLKIAPVLQNQASLMKLRVHGFLFLVFLHIKTGDKNKLSLLPHQHSDKKVFVGVSQEWKLWKILPDNNPNWNEHSFPGLFPGDVS